MGWSIHSCKATQIKFCEWQLLGCTLLVLKINSVKILPISLPYIFNVQNMENLVDLIYFDTMACLPPDQASQCPHPPGVRCGNKLLPFYGTVLTDLYSMYFGASVIKRYSLFQVFSVYLVIYRYFTCVQFAVHVCEDDCHCTPFP